MRFGHVVVPDTLYCTLYFRFDWTNQGRAVGWKIGVTQNSKFENSLHFLQQCTMSSLWACESFRDKPDTAVPFPMILTQSDGELLLKFAANNNEHFWNSGP